MYSVAGQALIISPAVPSPFSIVAVYWIPIAAPLPLTGPFQNVALLMTAAQFRANYKEFSDTNLYPDSAVNYWLAIASLLLNPNRWDTNMILLGVALYVAHNLVIEIKAQSAALKGGWPGMSRGAISAESAGQVSINFDSTLTLEEDAGHFALTEYGNRFIRLARMFGAGPAHIS